MSSTALTIQKQDLTENLYVAFKYVNVLEDYLGIVEFKNTDEDLKYHVEFVDFCFDCGVSIATGSYDVWLDVSLAKDREYFLFRNCCNHTVRDEYSLDILKLSILKAIQFVQSGKIIKAKKHGQKTRR